LAAVRNVSEAAVDEIIRVRQERSFEDLRDLCKRVDLKAVNRRSLEALIQAGGLDCIANGNTRRGLLQDVEAAISAAQRQKEREERGQTSLFADASIFGQVSAGSSVGAEQSSGETAMAGKTASEYSMDEILRLEREMLGFYVTSHPLADSEDKLAYFATHRLSEVPELADGAAVTVPVLLTDLNKKLTKANKLIAIAQVEDRQARLEAVFFSRVLDSYGALLREEACLLLKGKVQQKSEGDVSMMVESVRAATDLTYLHLRVRGGDVDWQSRFISLRNHLRKHPGDLPVILELGDGQKMVVDARLWSDGSEELLAELRASEWLEVSLETLNGDP
jgi:DNA polymerase-3 subunit alpha